MIEKNNTNFRAKKSKENIDIKEKNKLNTNSSFKKYENIIKIKNQIIVDEIILYLNKIYIALRNETNIYKEDALSLLETILNKLNYTQIEFDWLKDWIFEKTLIFFVLIKMYISKDNNKTTNDLLLKILKSLLIGNTEVIQTLFNLFPKSLFEKIQIDPLPFNWINEWDDFFLNIKQNFSEAILIWNEECRNELIQYLEKKFNEYDKINLNEKIRNKFISKENNKNEININKNENDFESLDKLDNELFLKMNNKTIEYQNFKLNYITLQNEVFVWKYYLKKLIKENQGIPSFVIDIENPKKLWKNIIMEICLQNIPERIIIMLKVLILLYRNYYTNKRKNRKDMKPLGKFKDYEFFLNLFKTYENIEIKSYIIQLLYASIKCYEIRDENRKNLLTQDEISSVILSFIRTIESFIKGESYSINFDVEEYSNKSYNFFYTDKEKEAIKFYKDVESKFVQINNGNFVNYSSYYPVDEENWKISDDKYKLLCIL